MKYSRNIITSILLLIATQLLSQSDEAKKALLESMKRFQALLPLDMFGEPELPEYLMTPSKKEVNLSAILCELMTSPKDTISYDNITVVDDLKIPTIDWIKNNFDNIKTSDSNRLIINKSLRLRLASNSDFALQGIHLNGTIDISTGEMKGFELDNCFFKYARLRISRTYLGGVYIANNEFHGRVVIGLDENFNNRIQNNTFRKECDIQFHENEFLKRLDARNEITKNNFYDKLEILGDFVHDIRVEENNFYVEFPDVFETPWDEEEFVRFDKQRKTNPISQIKIKELGELRIFDNKFYQTFEIWDTKILDKFIFTDNKFERKFGLSGTILPEFAKDIQWKQVQGLKLFTSVDLRQIDVPNSMFGRCDLCFPYYAIIDKELINTDRFSKLIDIYSTFYFYYKDRGDIESANGVFSEIQMLYGKRYAALYRTDGGIKLWFRWKLNQLMGFYIDYGTDPARAIQISFYIILLFAFFYFFFPSEWDITTKRKLFQSMKSKPEGISLFRNYFNFVGILLLSLLNAFALSLNSFITLGFGTIPTKGAAKYMCILQGCLGWFLLSLFTVALINQVIF